MTGLVYRSASNEVLHSWVEVFLEGVWYELEAIILDRPYLEGLQSTNGVALVRFAATVSR